MSRNTTYLILTAAATVTVVASVSAQAKPLLVPAGRSHPSVAPQLTGLSLGTTTVVAPGISISTPFAVESFKTSFGSGLGVSVGYGFNPIWSVFGSLDFAKQGSGISDAEGSFALVHAEAGVRANLPFSNPRVVPFASGSVGRRAVGARVTADGFDGSFDMSFSGMMVALGGGVQYFIRPNLAWEGGLELGLGKLNHVTLDGQSTTADVNSTNTIRLRFGVNWRPRST